MVREGGKQSGMLSRRKSKTSSSKCMWAEHQVGKPGTVFETRPRQLVYHLALYSCACQSTQCHVLYMFLNQR